jgi:hypothetical protein
MLCDTIIRHGVWCVLRDMYWEWRGCFRPEELLHCKNWCHAPYIWNSIQSYMLHCVLRRSHTLAGLLFAYRGRYFVVACKSRDQEQIGEFSFNLSIGVLRFDSRRGLGIFLFTTTSRTALGLTHSPIQWVSGALFLGVKRPGPEANDSPPSSAEINECVELYLHSAIRLHGVVLSLKKARGHLEFVCLCVCVCGGGFYAVRSQRCISVSWNYS